MTASSQQVGDLIEERFTSEDVSHHWCNSMILEWTFQNTAAFADALDYIVSLGPLNPTCDVVDRIIRQENLGTDETDQRSSSTYEITTTPTSNLPLTPIPNNPPPCLLHVLDGLRLARWRWGG